jgi:hypothetical protein
MLFKGKGSPAIGMGLTLVKLGLWLRALSFPYNGPQHRCGYVPQEVFHIAIGHEARLDQRLHANRK